MEWGGVELHAEMVFLDNTVNTHTSTQRIHARARSHAHTRILHVRAHKHKHTHTHTHTTHDLYTQHLAHAGINRANVVESLHSFACVEADRGEYVGAIAVLDEARNVLVNHPDIRKDDSRDSPVLPSSADLAAALLGLNPGFAQQVRDMKKSLLARMADRHGVQPLKSARGQVVGFAEDSTAHGAALNRPELE